MSEAVREVLAGMRSISREDWRDVSAFAPKAEKLLRSVAGKPDLIAALVDVLARDAELRAACESNPSLSKLTLIADPQSDTRLRIHFFSVDGEAEPHDHRWPFSALILRGAYRHTLYTPADGTDALQIVADRVERADSCYGLSTRIYHRTECIAPAISLMLRGPAQRSEWRRLGGNAPGGEVLSAGRSPAQQQFALTDGEFDSLTRMLRDAGLMS